MKKALLCSITMTLLFLTACGDSERVIEGSGAAQTASQASAQVQESVSASASAADSETSAEEGYVYLYQDITMAVDTDASIAVSALPEPLSYFEAASCAFEGLDKIYTYSGFELDTYPQGEQDFISAIILKDDSVSTPEGISIGDLRENVEETYGTDYQESANMLIYEKNDMQLRFILQGQSVVSIEYRTKVLD